MRADRDSSFFSDLDAPETPRTAMRRRDIRRRAARRRSRIATVLVAPLALAGMFYAGFSVLGHGGDDDTAQIVSAPLDDDASNDAGDSGAASGPTSKAPGPQVSSASPKGSRTTSDGASRVKVRTPAPTKTTTTSKAAAKPSTSTTTKTTKKPTTPATTRTTTAAGTGSTSTDAEAEVLRLVNVERGKAGCKAVKANGTLTTVARAHSKDMAVKGYFSHDTPGGKDPFERMSDAGYAYSWAAENIAAGQADPAAVMNSWMNSAGHKANILNCKLTELGVGMWKQSGSQYGIYWTQDFGTPR